MRRTSVVGPVILIGIGILFLLRNLWPQIPIGEIIGTYWPVLLILWGVLRLAEILMWAGSGKTLPRRGVSAGEWVLIFFLSLLAAGLYGMHRHRGWFPDGHMIRGMVVEMGDPYDYKLTPASAKAGKSPRIMFESFRGNARITGADTDQVRVEGRKTIRSFQQGEADSADKQTPLELVGQGDQIIVRLNQDRVNGNLRVSEDLEVTVPRGASVEANGRYGDFEVKDLAGSIEISSDNAGVRLDNIGGNVRIETRKSDLVRASNVKGNVDLKGRGQDLELQNIAGQVIINGVYMGQVQFSGLDKPLRFEGQRMELHVEKVPGQVRILPGDFSANDVTGPIRLSGRSINAQFTGFTGPLDLTLESGDVELRPGKLPLAKMEVRTGRSGDIDLALPANSKFDLHGTTNRGEIHNDYGGTLRVEDSGHGGATIAGAVEDGPPVRLTTDRGSITVRKTTGQEKVAVFPTLPTREE